MITLDIAKQHLKVSHRHEDELIELNMASAYEWIGQTINKTLFDDQEAFDGSSIHEDLKQIKVSAIDSAALLLVGHFYENREAVVVIPGSTAVVPLELGVDRLIAPYRNWGSDDRQA